MESVCQMISTVIQNKSNLPDKAMPTATKSVDQLKQTFVDEMMKTFDQADKDGDGNIDFMEFIKEQWEGRPGVNFINIYACIFRTKFGAKAKT